MAAAATAAAAAAGNGAPVVDEDAVPHLPPLELADLRFLLNSPDTTAEEKAEAEAGLRKGIAADSSSYRFPPFGSAARAR